MQRAERPGIAATRKRGIIVRASNDGVALSPPLILTKEHCDKAAEIIREAVEELTA